MLEGSDTMMLWVLTPTIYATQPSLWAKLSCPPLDLFLHYCASSWLADKVISVSSDSGSECLSVSSRSCSRGNRLMVDSQGPQGSSNFSELWTSLAGVSVWDQGDLWRKGEPMQLLDTCDPNGRWALCASLLLLQFTIPSGRFSTSPLRVHHW